jgi:hypothetical protein
MGVRFLPQNQNPFFSLLTEPGKRHARRFVSGCVFARELALRDDLPFSRRMERAHPFMGREFSMTETGLNAGIGRFS